MSAMETEELRGRLEAARRAGRAAADTIDRVAEVLNEFYTVRGDWYTKQGATALKDALLKAIQPKPSFELPTVPPARVIATRASGEAYAGEVLTLHLWADGNELIWADEDDWNVTYSPAEVMEQFTDHEVLK